MSPACHIDSTKLFFKMMGKSETGNQSLTSRFQNGRYKPPRCRERRYWQLGAASMRALIIAMTLAIATEAAAQSVPINPSDVRVLDGNTITAFNKQPNIRFVGFNAPETDRAACPTERELGIKAKDRLLALVRAGNLTFEYIRCSRPAGTRGTPVCNYGRDCGN
jgi:endonuclease YncB( thermonuclease family)